METLSPWDELLKALGHDVEKAGRMLSDEKPLSLEQLEVLSKSLKTSADVLDKRIASLQENG